MGGGGKNWPLLDGCGGGGYVEDAGGEEGGGGNAVRVSLSVPIAGPSYNVGRLRAVLRGVSIGTAILCWLTHEGRSWSCSAVGQGPEVAGTTWPSSWSFQLRNVLSYILLRLGTRSVGTKLAA